MLYRPNDKTTLYYGHDPMCSFCWAFHPNWEKIKLTLAKQYPELPIVPLLGGLAPDTDEPMPEEVRNKIIATWQYIEERIPGTQFNFDFWTQQQPRRSTYPACRAVYACKMLAPKQESKMVHCIQRAYYLKAQNPSNDNTLIHCATKIGLNEKQFVTTYQSETCDLGFTQEREFSRQLGITGFPSLVIAKGSRRFNVPIDYHSAKNTLDSLRQMMALL